MTLRLEHAKAELIDEVAAQAHERVPGDAADDAAEFVRRYYERVAPEDLVGRAAIDVYGAAIAHWGLAQQRPPGAPRVRVYSPDFDEHGWQSSHTAVEVVNEDTPFLVASVLMELNRQGYGIHLVVHPVVRVRRDAEGRLLGLVPPEAPAEEGVAESFIHVEVDRQTDHQALVDLQQGLEHVLADVRAATEDWSRMRAKALEIAGAIEREPTHLDATEVAEARAFLEWLADDNFTFLGYREYDLVSEGGEDLLRSVEGSGLGILREPRGGSVSASFATLPPEVRRRARDFDLLIITKANSRSTVHRAAYLDYIGIKRFDESGEVIGERRFLGLYATIVYTTSPTRIPLVRRKVEAVLRRSGLAPASYSYRALVGALET
jgi:glutamate dehydrogenase